MLRWIQKISLIAAVLLLVVAAVTFTHTPQANALPATACTATISPDAVLPASNNTFDINITSTGSSDIQWVDLTVPDGFTYLGNSIAGWNTSDHTGGTTATGSTLTQGQPADFYITAVAGSSDAASENWQILASSSAGRGNSSPVSCQGDISTSVSGSLPNDSDNGVSNVTVSDITSSSAVISWNTDSPMDSLVNYGQTSDYGSASAYDSSLDTDHSITLTGLSPETGYHYQVVDSDGQGDFAFSTDDTFLTDANPLPADSTTGVSETVTTTTAPVAAHSVIVGKGSAADKVPPQIAVNTKLSGTYKTVPTFTGTASDNIAVAKVNYSTDNGQNWLPVDILSTAGQRNVTFSFTPLLPQDGNYAILVRATDSTGNSTTTAPQTLIIDRLPPIVGGNIFSVGPQIIQPSSNGTINTQQGVDMKITLSAVGGPTSISLNAASSAKTKTGTKTYNQQFNLTASQNDGLWSGVVGFTRPGLYTLTVNAVDGAGNKTSRTLNDVYVSSPGHTLNKTSHAAVVSTVTAYYFEPESQSWVVWDGAAFGQNNPQKTDKSGAFSLFLPAGKYYLSATAPGYHSFVSTIFTLSQPSSVATDLDLRPLAGLHLASHYLLLPSLSVQTINATPQAAVSGTQSSLIGKQAPDFSLTDTTGATIQAADLLGKPTLISFESTWSPATAEQLGALSQLQANSDLNIVPVAVQQNADLVQAYSAISDLNLRWLVDPNGMLSSTYDVQSLPLNYFIDRNGIVREVDVGVLTEQEILNKLSGL